LTGLYFVGTLIPPPQLIVAVVNEDRNKNKGKGLRLILGSWVVMMGNEWKWPLWQALSLSC
jgi:hypothetical protein